MSILILEDVAKGFSPGFIPRRREILHGVALTVEAGEVFGFLGQNGAGKTTTIKLMVGLLYPDRGRVLLQGLDSRDPRSRRSLGFLPENPYFYDYLSGREFLDFYGRLYGLDRSVRTRRTGELLERFGLMKSADVALRRYSKGMVQRIGFAQALLAEPRLLILDEPMSGLDPIGRRLFRDIMMEERARGTTVFFSSHILQDAELVCDRIAILDAGRVHRVGRLDQMLDNSVSGYDISIAGAVDFDLPGEYVRRVTTAGAVQLIRATSLAEVEKVSAAARAAGGQVVALVPSRRTLEELFIGEVGGAA